MELTGPIGSGLVRAPLGAEASKILGQQLLAIEPLASEGPVAEVVNEDIQGHHQLKPRLAGPYAQVIVEMDEGPRVLSWVVDVPPEELEFGMRVNVAFLDVEGTTLPVFERGDG